MKDKILKELANDALYNRFINLFNFDISDLANRTANIMESANMIDQENYDEVVNTIYNEVTPICIKMFKKGFEYAFVLAEKADENE